MKELFNKFKAMSVIERTLICMILLTVVMIVIYWGSYSEKIVESFDGYINYFRTSYDW